MADVLAAREKLPAELLERFDAIIVKAKREIENDPYRSEGEETLGADES
jgi:hypothetical protein